MSRFLAVVVFLAVEARADEILMDFDSASSLGPVESEGLTARFETRSEGGVLRIGILPASESANPSREETFLAGVKVGIKRRTASSLTLKPKKGIWDLSKHLYVFLSVRNAGPGPLHLQAKLENPVVNAESGSVRSWLTLAENSSSLEYSTLNWK